MNKHYPIDYIYANDCPAPWGNTPDACCYWCEYFQGIELKKKTQLKVICSFLAEKDKHNFTLEDRSIYD